MSSSGIDRLNMGTARHMIALLRSHLDGDGKEFLSVAMQAAAHEARLVHRDAGSVHSDYWRGTAVELAQWSAIGVYPFGGWWKESPAHKGYSRSVRYCLVVSIRAMNGSVDIYTPVWVQDRNAYPNFELANASP